MDASGAWAISFNGEIYNHQELRTSLAAELVAVFVIATYLVDLLAPPLNLPDWVHRLALTAHFGQPMAGSWDVVGVAACIAIAVAGTLVGVWGIRRRDIAR